MRFASSSYMKPTSRNSIERWNGGSTIAPGASSTSVCVSSISKMRSDAAIACCRFAFTRLNFFAGPYMRNSVPMNSTNCPVVS
jgi:hypothetical protein